MGWFGESLGWLIGSKEHCRKQRDANRPKMQTHESEVDHAKAVLAYEDGFNHSYWPKAYLKRAAILLVIIMAFTNPSFESFKKHVKTTYGFGEDLCSKNFNALLFTKFSVSGHSFIGAFGTFFSLGNAEIPIVRVVNKQDSVYKDPTKKRDTFKKFLPIPLPASVDTNADREFHQPVIPPGQQQQQRPPDTIHF